MSNCYECKYYRTPNFCGLGYANEPNCDHKDSSDAPTIELVVLTHWELECQKQAGTLSQVPKAIKKIFEKAGLSIHSYKQRISKVDKKEKTRTVEILHHGNTRGQKDNLLNNLNKIGIWAEFKNLTNGLYGMELIFQEPTKYYKSHQF